MRQPDSLQIGAESEVSFATYFNAFPASYWRRWTTCKSVVLRVQVTGAGRVDVYRTKATGARIFVEGHDFTGTEDQPAAVETEVVLQPFEDGGWVWFDITTDTAVTLHSGGWYATSPAPGRPTSRSASRRSTAPQTASTRCENSPPIRWWTR